LSIGLDTLKLRLSDYEIGAHPSLTLEHSSTDLETGEAGMNYRLWRGVEGRRAYHNAERFNVTIAPANPKEPDSIGCTVQFSAPRLATGDNYSPSDQSTTVAALDKLAGELKLIGVKTNLHTARLSRVDITRNVTTEEPFSCYAPALSMLSGKRMSKREYGGTAYLWENTKQQVAVYDKLAEMQARKVPTEGFALTSRFEWRLLNGRKAKDVLGMGTPAEVLQDFGEVQAAYRDAMKAQLFRYDASDVEVLLASDIAADMRHFQETCGREWMAAYLKTYGLYTLLQLASIETIKGVVAEVAGNRMQTSRIARELDRLRFEGESLRISTGSKRTVGSLYQELQDKVLAA
jgi:hypothetical protein